MLPKFLDGLTIAFDGKRICSSNYDKPLHILSAYLCESGLTIGQKTVDEKSNEIPVMREIIFSMQKVIKRHLRAIFRISFKMKHCVLFGKGSEHDFSIFKRTFDWAHPDIYMLGDSGFQGILTHLLTRKFSITM